MGTLRQNRRVSRRVLILGLALLPLGLAGCSVEWSLAAKKSEGRYEVVLPSCTIESIASVSLLEDVTYEVVWRVTAVQPVTGQREIVIGEVGPGFREVTPLLGELTPGVTYTARINFSGPRARVLASRSPPTIWRTMRCGSTTASARGMSSSPKRVKPGCAVAKTDRSRASSGRSSGSATSCRFCSSSWRCSSHGVCRSDGPDFGLGRPPGGTTEEKDGVDTLRGGTEHDGPTMWFVPSDDPTRSAARR